VLDLGDVFVGDKLAVPIVLENSSPMFNQVVFSFDHIKLQSRYSRLVDDCLADQTALEACVQSHAAFASTLLGSVQVTAAPPSDDRTEFLRVSPQAAILGPARASSASWADFAKLSEEKRAEAAVNSLPHKCEIALKFEVPLILNPDGIPRLSSFDAFPEMRTVGTPGGPLALSQLTPVQIHTNLYVYSTSLGVRTIKVTARVRLHELELTPAAVLDFGKCIPYKPAQRTLTLSNVAAYAVPFNVQSTHNAWNLEPANGIIAGKGSQSIIVRFLSPTPFSASSEAGRPHAVRVKSLENVLVAKTLALAVQCVEFAFDVRQLGDVDFGGVMIKSKAAQRITLKNISITDAPFKFLLPAKSAVALRPGDYIGIVPAGQQRTVTLEFTPFEESQFETALTLEAVSGNFQIKVVLCVQYVYM
jgi:hypothetical protein